MLPNQVDFAHCTASQNIELPRPAVKFYSQGSQERHEQTVLEQGLITSVHQLDQEFGETKILSTKSPKLMKTLKNIKRNRESNA